MKHEITARLIDSTPTPTHGRTRLSDSLVTGFFVRISTARVITYYLEIGPAHRRRKLRIGTYPALTPREAREKAREIVARVQLGGDPAEERDTARRIPLYRDWAELYLKTLEGKRKSVAEIRAYLLGRPGGRGNRPGESVSPPRPSLAATMLGNRTLTELGERRTLPDGRPGLTAVEEWFITLSERGKIAANRGLAALRGCLKAAVARGYLATNPAVIIERWPENAPRNTRLDDAERERLLHAIEELPNPFFKAFFLMLMMTGCRKSEALRCRHEDFRNGTWMIPSPKAGYPQSIPVPAELQAVIAALPRRLGSPYVFPGRRQGSHMEDPANTWRALRRQCGIEHVHLHDLRRDFCWRSAKATSIKMASLLLRHSNLAITERVYHGIRAEDLRDAVEATAATLQFRKATP